MLRVLDEPEALLHEVAGLEEKEAEDVELVMAPLVGDLVEGERVDARVHDGALGAVQVGLLADAADDLLVELLEDGEHDAVGLGDLLVEAEVLVRVGGVHDVAEPVHVVAVVALVAGVGRGDVAAVDVAQLLEMVVGDGDLLIDREIVEALHERRHGPARVARKMVVPTAARPTATASSTCHHS